jgi:hypothetical protein
MANTDNDFRIEDNKFIDVRLISCIMERMGVDMNEADRIIRYNVLTISQLADISGRSISAIQNHIRPIKTINGNVSRLKEVFLFPSKEKPGPAFVVFDQNCFDYIMSTYKPNSKKE